MEKSRQVRAGGLFLLHTHLHSHSLMDELCIMPWQQYLSCTCFSVNTRGSLAERSIVHHLLTKLHQKNNQGKLLGHLRWTSSSHHSDAPLINQNWRVTCAYWRHKMIFREHLEMIKYITHNLVGSYWWCGPAMVIRGSTWRYGWDKKGTPRYKAEDNRTKLKN